MLSTTDLTNADNTDTDTIAAAHAAGPGLVDARPAGSPLDWALADAAAVLHPPALALLVLDEPMAPAEFDVRLAAVVDGLAQRAFDDGLARRRSGTMADSVLEPLLADRPHGRRAMLAAACGMEASPQAAALAAAVADVAEALLSVLGRAPALTGAVVATADEQAVAGLLTWVPGPQAESAPNDGAGEQEGR